MKGSGDFVWFFRGCFNMLGEILSGRFMLELIKVRGLRGQKDVTPDRCTMGIADHQ